MLISLSELKTNPSKYVEISNKEVVYITKNGKKVAKLIGTNADRVADIKKIFGILPPDTDPDQIRMERLND